MTDKNLYLVSALCSLLLLGLLQESCGGQPPEPDPVPAKHQPADAADFDYQLDSYFAQADQAGVAGCISCKQTDPKACGGVPSFCAQRPGEDSGCCVGMGR